MKRPSHRIPEPAFGPIRSQPIEAERLDRAAEEGFARGLKCDPYNHYKKGSPEWHRWEAGFYLGRIQARKAARAPDASDGTHMAASAAPAPGTTSERLVHVGGTPAGREL